MGVIIRQSIQNTIISYIGVALGFVSTILLYPNILQQDQYGLTRVLFSLALVCSQFAHLGINNIVIRYFPYFKQTNASRRRLLSLTLLVPLLGFILFVTCYLLMQDLFVASFDDRSSLFPDFYLLLIPLVFAILFFEALNSYIRAMQDSVTGSFVNEVLMRFLIILLLVVHHYEWLSFSNFMLGFVLAYLFQPIYLLVYLYLKGELAFASPFQGKARRMFKGMGVYGIYSLLGGLATLLIGNIDIIMLGGMTDLDSTAVYAIAFYVGSVIAIPQRSIVKIATPVLADLIKQKKFSRVSSLYQRTSINQIIAGSLLYVGIWANMHNLLDLLPPEYADTKWVIIVIGAAKLFNMATGVNGSIIINSRYFRFDLYTNLLLILLSILTNYILILQFGILGAAIATALSIFIYNFIKFIFVWMKFGMQPFRWNSLAVIVIATGCLWFSSYIPYLYNFFIDVAVRSLSITLVFIGLILLLNLSEDVKTLLHHMVTRAKSYLR